MEDLVLDDLVAIVAPLLRSLDALGFVQRYMDPNDVGAVLRVVGAPDEQLREARPRLEAWPERLADVRAALESASDDVIGAFEGLRAAEGNDNRIAFRALRLVTRAQEALYPLASDLPPISRFFLDPASRGDEALHARLLSAPASPNTGVFHGAGPFGDDEPGARGAYSLYVPEYYDPATPLPLVVALHGGSGNGRGFLWSWLREARSYGAILVAPTAVGETWAIMDEDADTPNLMRILDEVRRRWNVDPARMLLTGMSDGGTFCYVSGLEAASPFTHLAPACAAFHGFLAEMAEPERLMGLPIHVTHGARDWMFPVTMARDAAGSLMAYGAKVIYRELDDLGHTYPREINPEVLRWMAGT